MTEDEVFKMEAFELLDEIEQTLLQLREIPDNKDLLNKLFRDFHTIKGSGGMFGFPEVADFTHYVENGIDTLRKGAASFTPDLLDPLLDCRDHVAKLIEAHDPTSDLLRTKGEQVLSKLDIAIHGPVTDDATPDKELAPEKPTRRIVKILVVEDDFVARVALQEFLSPFGNPHIASDGYEAILAVKKSLTEGKPYDLICLDIVMEGIDGFKVAEEIRRFERDFSDSRAAKILIISSLSEQDMQNNLAAGTIDAFMQKPISMKKLDSFVHKVLQT